MSEIVTAAATITTTAYHRLFSVIGDAYEAFSRYSAAVNGLPTDSGFDRLNSRTFLQNRKTKKVVPIKVIAYL